MGWIHQQLQTGAQAVGSDPALLGFGIAVLALLVIGTVWRLAAWWLGTSPPGRDRLRSLLTWWAIALAVVAAVLLGRIALCVLMAGVSAAALREYLRNMHPGRASMAAQAALYAGVVGLYACIAADAPLTVLLIVPAATIVVLLTVCLRYESTDRFLTTVGSFALAWGLCVCLPAIALVLPVETERAAVRAFVVLLVLTELNDIAAALIGKTLGRRKIAPTLSPNKTWAGTVGGLIVTAMVGALGILLLLHIAWPWGAVGGAAIGIAGFFGDLNMSAIKRDRGLDDSGDVLPGQGGVLDRIDSLTFTAPVFYLFLLGVGT